MRVFYVLPVNHPTAAPLLDGLRFICDPKQKTRAHITVRGPYRQHYRLARANSTIRGTVIRVEGPGRFFSQRQNTIYLSVHSPYIRHIWYKPDYDDFHPHVTIYDGNARSFAGELFALLETYPLSFAFRAVKLEALVTSRGQADSFLKLNLNLRLLSQIVKQRLSLEAIQCAEEPLRLRWAESIIRHLSTSLHATTTRGYRRSSSTLQRALPLESRTASSTPTRVNLRVGT